MILNDLTPALKAEAIEIVRDHRLGPVIVSTLLRSSPGCVAKL